MPYCCLQLLLKLTLLVYIFKSYILFLKTDFMKLPILFKELKYKIICFVRGEKNPEIKSTLSSLHPGTGF